MNSEVLYTVKDYHTGDELYNSSAYAPGDIPKGDLFNEAGETVTSNAELFVDGDTSGIRRPLVDSNGTPVAIYTHDWLTNTYIRETMSGSEQTFSPGGVEYPGGRPTELEYVAGMDTLNPPQPEPEPEPEPDPGTGDPEPEPDVPEPPVFDEYDLIEAMGDEAPTIEVARAAMRAATDLIDTYTRGAAYRRIRVPRPGVNAVAHTVAARIAANPGLISRRDQAGNFSRSLGAGFNGFTLTEKTALDSYRRTAR